MSDIITNTLDERLSGLTSVEAYYGNQSMMSSEPKLVIIQRENNKFIVPTVGSFECIKLACDTEIIPLDLSKPEDREYLRGKWIVSTETGNESLVTTFGMLNYYCNVIEYAKVEDLWYKGAELNLKFKYLYSDLPVGRIKTFAFLDG